MKTVLPLLQIREFKKVLEMKKKRKTISTQELRNTRNRYYL